MFERNFATATLSFFALSLLSPPFQKLWLAQIVCSVDGFREH